MDEDDKQTLEAGVDGHDGPVSARRMQFGQRYDYWNEVNRSSRSE
ncbi:hypothetical protein J14TS5_46820 [Paenibacillus lautus]|nr:hypothetical protein J14TS5_46820 [Paenibacillus lautus]